MKTSIVLAHKFNDIFYAVNTAEFNLARYHILIIFSSKNLSMNSFPLLDKFDRIIHIPYSLSIFKFSKNLFKIYRALRKYKNCVVFTTNIRLVMNQFIISLNNIEKVVLLEDGLMNYKKVVFVRHIKMKKILQFLLGINQTIVYDKVSSTYLNSPEEGVNYFGELKQINLLTFPKKAMLVADKINDTSILIGMPIYKYGCLSKREYYSIVSEIMIKFKIDQYLPHHFEDDLPVNFEFNMLEINDLSITFEMICGIIENVSLYSFGSTLLFTSKKINNKIKCIFIENQDIYKFDSEGLDFLKRKCDEVINL